MSSEGASAPKSAQVSASRNAGEIHDDKGKERDVRTANIIAARAVADCVRTSLGPRGMDKMVVPDKGDVIITNDGATVMKQLEVTHPAAKMLVSLSNAQDVEAGDGTTSVVVVAGALLHAAQKMIEKGIHPTQVTDSFQKAMLKAVEIVNNMGIDVDLSNRDTLVQACVTSLSSKVVSNSAQLLSPIAVDAVLSVCDLKTSTSCNLKDVRVVQKLGDTIDESELINGIVFDQKASHRAGGPCRIASARIGLAQFQLAPPKPDMDNQMQIADYQQMDRFLREEKAHIVKLCKQIKDAGCNVLLLQKSVLKDSVTDLSLSVLAKMGIMLIRDVEREDVEFISKALGCTPVATPSKFTADKLGHADLVEEVGYSGGKIVKITGIKKEHKTVTILLRGSNKMVLEEAERSLHDALCVVRSLVKVRKLLPGGSAPEMEISCQLLAYANTLLGADALCVRAYAEALELIPTTLAENAGLNPISIVTELRNRHARGEKYAGINVKKGTVSNSWDDRVIQPALVTTSLLKLATETVRMILKIDDIIASK